MTRSMSSSDKAVPLGKASLAWGPGFPVSQWEFLWVV